LRRIWSFHGSVHSKSAPRAAGARTFRGKAEPPPQNRKWLALSIAAHGAAGFDAWSTRRVISSVPQTREANPLLRPFAGNASMYYACRAACAKSANGDSRISRNFLFGPRLLRASRKNKSAFGGADLRTAVQCLIIRPDKAEKNQHRQVCAQ
jgi:hypothetical protein